MFGAAGGVGEICENILQLAYVQPKELISPAALQHFTTQKSKPSLKIGTASAIFWIYLSIFTDYGLRNIHFWNEFVFKDSKLKLLASV